MSLADVAVPPVGNIPVAVGLPIFAVVLIGAIVWKVLERRHGGYLAKPPTLVGSGKREKDAPDEPT